MILQADCLDFVKTLEDESVQLAYFDPPFGTDKEFKDLRGKYKDKSKAFMSQLLYDLLTELKPKLQNTGVVAIHVDFRLNYIVRKLCDDILGERNFVNDIVWSYKTGGSTDKRFSRKHDNIIVYSKTQNYTFNPLKEKSYNREFKKYSFKGVEEFCDADGKWYTLVNMRDVWTDIPAVGRTSKERVNYPTQKPLELAKRVITAFSSPNDLVVDFFSGSGTHLLAAKQLGRSIQGCDASEDAVKTTNLRLSSFKNDAKIE